MTKLIADEAGRPALVLPPRAATLLTQILGEASTSACREEILESITSAIEQRLAALTNIEDHREPSYVQVTYAIAIARDLAVALPPDALRHRHATQKFLSKYAPIHRRLESK